MKEILSFTAYRQLSQALIAIAFFNVSEYSLAIIIHGRSNVSLKTTLITINTLSDILGSILEYSLEIAFFPTLKEYWWISNLGLILVVLGELVRKLAIVTAGRGFTLQLKNRRENDHKLVTNGVYGVFRHPGYFGFLIWSIGIQMMLVNPVCGVVLGVLVRNFFAERISQEEAYLRSFFGSDYVAYAKRVPSGIPFVK